MTKYNFTEHFNQEMYKQFKVLNLEYLKEKSLTDTDIYAPIDIIVELGKRKWVLIELEIHRADPSNNIAKIAYWLAGPGKEYDITVIQVFSPHYNDTKGGFKAKRKLAEYLGKELIKKLHHKRYCAISTEVMDKEEFEQLYRLFDGKHESPKLDTKLRMLVDDYVEQILRIINF